MCGAGEHAGLERRSRRGLAKIGMRQQEPDGERGDQPSAPSSASRPRRQGEFRLAVGVEHAPIGADAAFVGLPRLVERLDDRIVDAHGVGAGDEIADDLGLGQRIGTASWRLRPALGQPNSAITMRLPG